MKICNLKPSEIPAALEKIQDLAGYHFKDIIYLQLALTHPSYAIEHPADPRHNQRLEFLGDAVLELVLSEYLFEHLTDAQEGVLTRVRSILANEKATAEYAERLGLPRALMLGNGENMTGGRNRQSIIGDSFEAFLGAAYLDGGYETAKQICMRLFPEDPDVCVHSLGIEENPKGALQEFCQAHKMGKPEYIRSGCRGPVHAPEFEIRVMISGQEHSRCWGNNLKQATSAAAREALLRLLDREKTRQQENSETPAPPTDAGPRE